mmetsp:Transcript_12278/g.21910  ORF Transcript_12278/g.21910 Transcript_12278/m.21910 type:complete len:324 (+) Transcript_12278:141-1112(+)
MSSFNDAIHGPKRCTSAFVATGVFCLILLLVIYANGLDAQGKVRGFWPAVSWLIGWLYFLAWSLSFYPQLLLNYNRKSTKGLSYNFVWLNLLGFGCYSIFNLAFFYSSAVQEDYRLANHGEENLVRANDVFFALHAVVITSLTLVQMYYCGYKSDDGNLVWVSVRVFIMAAIGVSLAYLVGVLSGTSTRWSPGKNNFWTILSWLYFVSYIKLVITLCKYLPQVYLNYQRKSTVGWSIANVLLDFTGGFLSLIQLFIDASLENDWSSVFGDPVKLGLSLLSLSFDMIFILQQYVFYGNGASADFEDVSEEDTTPLRPDSTISPL